MPYYAILIFAFEEKKEFLVIVKFASQSSCTSIIYYQYRVRVSTDLHPDAYPVYYKIFVGPVLFPPHCRSSHCALLERNLQHAHSHGFYRWGRRIF